MSTMAWSAIPTPKNNPPSFTLPLQSPANKPIIRCRLSLGRIRSSKTEACFSDEETHFKRRDLLGGLTFSAGMGVVGSSGLLVENANAADLIQRRQRSEFQSSIKGTLYAAIKGNPDIVSPILTLALNDAITYDKATKTGAPNGSIRFRLCHFPSSIHILPQQTTCYGLEHQKRCNVAIALSKRRVQTRVLPSSIGLADAAVTAAATVLKPVNISVLIQTSALLFFMYYVTNFVVPQIITRKFDEEEENQNR